MEGIHWGCSAWAKVIQITGEAPFKMHSHRAARVCSQNTSSGFKLILLSFFLCREVGLANTSSNCLKEKAIPRKQEAVFKEYSSKAVVNNESKMQTLKQIASSIQNIHPETGISLNNKSDESWAYKKGRRSWICNKGGESLLLLMPGDLVRTKGSHWSQMPWLI